jgi:hypothetical protein
MLAGVELRAHLGEAARRAIRDLGTVTLPCDRKVRDFSGGSASEPRPRRAEELRVGHGQCCDYSPFSTLNSVSTLPLLEPVSSYSV